jgi:hypothetical protein
LWQGLLSSSTAARLTLYEVGKGDTDGLRQELDVPSLAQAWQREDQMNEMVKGTQTPTKR